MFSNYYCFVSSDYAILSWISCGSWIIAHVFCNSGSVLSVDDPTTSGCEKTNAVCVRLCLWARHEIQNSCHMVGFTWYTLVNEHNLDSQVQIMYWCLYNLWSYSVLFILLRIVTEPLGYTHWFSSVLSIYTLCLHKFWNLETLNFTTHMIVCSLWDLSNSILLFTWLYVAFGLFPIQFYYSHDCM